MNFRSIDENLSNQQRWSSLTFKYRYRSNVVSFYSITSRSCDCQNRVTTTSSESRKWIFETYSSKYSFTWSRSRFDRDRPICASPIDDGYFRTCWVHLPDYNAKWLMSLQIAAIFEHIYSVSLVQGVLRPVVMTISVVSVIETYPKTHFKTTYPNPQNI